jgi:[ribosomal protein S18]-alanine N-acetyltransferase
MRVEFTVRSYRQEDFLTLWRIDQSCFDPEIAYSQEELRRYLKWPGSFSLVAESLAGGREGLEISGFLVGNHGKAAGHIITIDVIAAARGNGVGSVLLDTAEAQLQLCGCRTVRLETAVDNIGALSFYKKHGYSVVKTVPRYYSNGTDALVLEKDLHSPLPSDNVQK